MFFPNNPEEFRAEPATNRIDTEAVQFIIDCYNEGMEPDEIAEAINGGKPYPAPVIEFEGVAKKSTGLRHVMIKKEGFGANMIELHDWSGAIAPNEAVTVKVFVKGGSNE